MPPKINIDERVKQFSQDGMVKSQNIMICRFCNKTVAWETSDGVKKHIRSNGHVEAVKKGKRQKTMFEAVEGAKEAKVAKMDFITSTVEMMVSANIPLEKADHPAFRQWVKKQIVGGGDLPSSDTLRRDYLPQLAKFRKDEVVTALKEKSVAIMSDETTDKLGRAIYVVLLSTVEPCDSQQQYVAAVTSLEAVNGRTCARAISDALQDMEVGYDQVVAFVSDAASYMKSCFDGLSVLLPDSVVQVQCWAHKVNLLGVLMKNSLSELNQVVISVKQIFLNARKKHYAFQQFLQQEGSSAGFFPIPVVTRLNSWLTAVEWLSDNWEILFAFLRSETARENNFNGGSSHLQTLGEEELGMLHVQSLFVKSVSSLIKPFLVSLETNSKPMASEVYPKLQFVRRRLQIFGEGVFSDEVKESANKLKSLHKGKTSELLKKTAQQMSLKLDKLMSEDPARKYLQPVAELFHKQNILTQDVTSNELKVLFSKVPLLKDIELDQGVHAYTELAELLRTHTNLSVFEALNSMQDDHRSFVVGALRAIWMPVSNVDCERFFSQFSGVLTNRRTNLSRTNLELLSSYAYEAFA